MQAFFLFSCCCQIFEQSWQSSFFARLSSVSGWKTVFVNEADFILFYRNKKFLTIKREHRIEKK
jgi:hypothetical protein